MREREIERENEKGECEIQQANEKERETLKTKRWENRFFLF